jgi:hypothetical protein
MSSFLKSLKEIYDGWKNDLFPSPEIEALAKERAEMCALCTLNINNTCSLNVSGPAVKDFEYKEEFRIKGRTYSGCGCPLSKKTRSPESKCPLGKW